MPWVAGSEPELLRTMPGFVCTNLPEKYGVDILWRVPGGYCGAQRKELGDLLGSVVDGRLGKEVKQMKPLLYRWLIVEGEAKWTNGGFMYRRFGRNWTKPAYEGLLRGIAAQGVIVESTKDLTDTKRLIPELIAWSKKSHSSLEKRPGPVSSWGKADDHDYQVYFLQGLPGVGAELAERILKHIGMPIGWRISIEDLLGIPGIGKKKAEAIWAALKPI